MGFFVFLILVFFIDHYCEGYLISIAYCPSFSFSQVETHAGSKGERTKYFDDDDKFDLKTMVSPVGILCRN